jgi:hypothetical protein
MINKALIETDETSEGNSDVETGQIGGFSMGGGTDFYAQKNRRFHFFAGIQSTHASFFRPQLKPDLTETEKEILHLFLKALGLGLDEFKLKLASLKMSIKTFTTILMHNARQLKSSNPKFAIELLSDLISRGLLPEKAFEALISKDLLARYNAGEFELKHPRNSRRLG